MPLQSDFGRVNVVAPIWSHKAGALVTAKAAVNWEGSQIDDTGYFNIMSGEVMKLQLALGEQTWRTRPWITQQTAGGTLTGTATVNGMITSVLFDFDSIPATVQYAANSDPVFAKMGRCTFINDQGYAEPVQWINWQKAVILPSVWGMKTVGWGCEQGALPTITINYIPIGAESSLDLQYKYALQAVYDHFNADSAGNISTFPWDWTDPDNFPPPFSP